MYRLNTRNRKPTPVEAAKQYNGYNAAYAMTYVALPNMVSRVNELKATNPNFVLRFPGGSLGNYCHPTGKGYGLIESELGTSAPTSVRAVLDQDVTFADNHLGRMVQLAQDTGAKVCWMANIYTGTPAEAITAIQAFIDGGVEVVGMELGNEWYLGRYGDTYPDHTAYISAAKTFRDAVKVTFPTLPMGIVICPSAAMKDIESGSGRDALMNAANAAIRALTWPDAYVLHAYAGVNPAVTPFNTPEAARVCLDHRVALRNHIASFPGRSIWITEWNLAGTGGGDSNTQAEHYAAMREYITTEPRVTIQTVHNLIGSGVGNNVIKGTGAGCTLNRIGRIAAGIEPAMPVTIDPKDVTVVANSDDPQSAAMATAYAAAKGIPSSNIITVACGGTLATPEATSAQATALYNAINAAGRQYTMLAMRYPSRTQSGQSITSAATFGVRAVNLLSVSELYGYSGYKPYTDKGRRPAAILLSSAYRRDGVVLSSGTSYMVLANDTSRTPSRAGQKTTPGIVALDSTAAGAGPGASYCNQLSQQCWITGFMDALEPVNMAFYSTHHIAPDNDLVNWLPGFYGDSVSSYWGYLPTPLDAQTPCTYFLDRGASMSCGTVSEPWQAGGSAAGSLKEQFVDISIFRPLFVANKPVGVATWAATKCPDRTLMAGDMLFTPSF